MDCMKMEMLTQLFVRLWKNMSWLVLWKNYETIAAVSHGKEHSCRLLEGVRDCLLLSLLVGGVLNLLLFLRFFSFLAQKALKMTISTRIWGAQHLNASQNIKHKYKPHTSHNSTSPTNTPTPTHYFISNLWPLPMPNNCSLVCGSLLLQNKQKLSF